MSDVKHTPGPWKQRDRDEYHEITGNWFGDEDAVIAKTAPVYDHRRGIYHRTNQANADLITAAPDLLASCEADHALQQHLSTCHNCTPLCEVGNNLRVRANELRQIALAKAEGKS